MSESSSPNAMPCCYAAPESGNRPYDFILFAEIGYKSEGLDLKHRSGLGADGPQEVH